ncbi:hypothetical protein GPECTOR_3g358 [Gonium pectorale]|uniref:Uncharacterized protein n=1 Tax=Gonium pectorale TaxID=33097 RepID=A0A150GZH2_GONPE|nr:hypothetical protein GPECTOR_3g358 [Gonium pectorale]|eukprot:KXZ55215.1 hypothetical protein GPECTOR_3g358 [Gonium pectorale]
MACRPTSRQSAGPLPSAPPAALAPALSCGLLPALECCVRTLGRSTDPRDVGSLCELLRGSLLEQPVGLAAVLAFGPPGHAVPLLTSLAKVLHRCVDAAEAEAANAAAAVEAGPSMPQSRPQEDARERACANVADLAALMGRALSAVWTDPWVAEVASSTPSVGGIDTLLTVAAAAFGLAPTVAAVLGPAPAAIATHEVPPPLLQLRRLLPLLLQRWLPALARAVAVALGLPTRHQSATYGAAQDSLGGLAVALFASADHTFLKGQTRLRQVLSLNCVRGDHALSLYVAHVFEAAHGTCALDCDGFSAGAASALCDRRALALLRLAASLERPAGEGPAPPAEGLPPPACANPRCTNLAGESDAGLMAAAAVEAAGGSGRDGGGDGWDSGDQGGGGSGSRSGHRVSLWCFAECQRAGEGRGAEGSGGGAAAEAEAGPGAGRRRDG